MSTLECPIIFTMSSVFSVHNWYKWITDTCWAFFPSPAVRTAERLRGMSMAKRGRGGVENTMAVVSIDILLPYCSGVKELLTSAFIHAFIDSMHSLSTGSRIYLSIKVGNLQNNWPVNAREAMCLWSLLHVMHTAIVNCEEMLSINCYLCLNVQTQLSQNHVA